MDIRISCLNVKLRPLYFMVIIIIIIIIIITIIIIIIIIIIAQLHNLSALYKCKKLIK